MLKPCANRFCHGVQVSPDLLHIDPKCQEPPRCMLCGRTEQQALIRELEVLNAISRRSPCHCPDCGKRIMDQRHLPNHARFCEKRPKAMAGVKAWQNRETTD